MSAHTPGPWGYSDAGANFHAYTQSDVHTFGIHGPRWDGPQNSWLADCYSGRIGSDGISRDEALANARLVASAPELLEACKTFAEWLRREEQGSRGQPWEGKRDTAEGEAAWRVWFYENLAICDLAQKQARAAIAKATGESQ